MVREKCLSLFKLVSACLLENSICCLSQIGPYSAVFIQVKLMEFPPRVRNMQSTPLFDLNGLLQVGELLQQRQFRKSGTIDFHQFAYCSPQSKKSWCFMSEIVKPLNETTWAASPRGKWEGVKQGYIHKVLPNQSKEK